MKTLVVFFVFAAVAHASILPLAQPAHHPAVVVDARGRPLDTTEVIEARALHLQAKALEAHYAPVVAAVAPVAVAHSVAPVAVAHSIAVPAVVAAPAAVSHQSRVDVHSSPAIVSHAIAAPVIAHAAPALVGHGHYLKKRSLSHLAYTVPAIAPAAVTHQSRVDVISRPAVVSHAVATPVIAHAVATPVVAPAIALAPAAISHQSRVDVRTSPAVVVHAPVAAVTHAVVAAPAYSAYGHGHVLKKRSLAAVVAPVVHAVPAAVSHQSRVDVISEPSVVAHAAPVAVAHVAPAVIAAPAVVAVPAAVSRQSRVDVISSAVRAAPLAHSAVWTGPVARLTHAGLVKTALW